MSEWRRASIADVASQDPHALATGPFGSAISAKNFVDVGVPVIRGSNLSLDVGVRLNDSGLAFLTEAKAAEFKRSVARRGDLVFTCWGTVGQIGLIDDRATYDEYIVSNKQMKLTPDPARADSTFLYYLLSSPDMVRSVTGQAIGAAVPGFNLGQLKDITVLLPPLSVQTQIADVLNSIDDLIENNRRRVDVLGEMARTIYREWFVKFRYPGHEGVPLVDSALGPIPEAWEVRSVSEVARVVRGRSYKSAELVTEGGLPFINLKCMARGGGFKRNGLKRYIGQYTQEQLVGAGDLVLAVTDLTQGREILARATLVPRLREGRGVISLDVIRLVPVDDSERLWLFASLAWSDFSGRLKEFANGSTVLHLSPKHVEEAPTLWAPEALRRQLTGVIEPCLAEIEELSEQTRALAALRDLLLPKLVTGQIDVSALDLNALREGQVA